MTGVFLSVPKYDWCAPFIHCCLCFCLASFLWMSWLQHWLTMWISRVISLMKSKRFVGSVFCFFLLYFCRAPKQNTSHGKEVLLQDAMHLIQRPCYQWGSPCQDPAGNQTTQRPPDHRKEMQTAVVCTCLLVIRSISGQNHLARHSEIGKKTSQAEKEVERQQEWTGLPQRAVENREKCRKVVVKSSVVLQRPLWLWDRWSWCWLIPIQHHEND